MKNSLIVSLLCVTFISCSRNEVVKRKSDFNDIIADFDRQMEFDVSHDSIGSISVCVFKDDQIVWSKAFGYANKENKILADSNTIYRTASISKTITAYVMMMLVQNGTIHLDDPIADYLPEIEPLDSQASSAGQEMKITFRQLANHTSGLSREPALANAASGPIEEWEHKVLASIPTIELKSTPGEKYAYSNIGYGILGLALSRAASKPFMDLVHEMVFEPLKMESSFFIIPESAANNVSTGYEWYAFKGIITSEVSEAEHGGRGYKVPNGGIYSTPNDLARFIMAQTNRSEQESNNLLTKEHAEIMQYIQTPESKEFGYGFGYYIRTNDKGIKMVEHDGGVAGYQAMMVFNPQSRIGVVMMRNYDFGLTNILLEPRTLLSRLHNSQAN